MKLGDMQQNPRHLINGRWEIGTTTGVSTNPSDTREVVAEHARADRNQTEQAVRAASDALASWSHSNPQRRADVLDLIGSELLARKDELGKLLAREEGKTLPEAVAEVARSGQIFKFFAGEALRIPGELHASVRQGVQVDVTREPVGVVGIIAPWNFPFAIPAWKIAPALAYGNTVVFKPAENVPTCGWALSEIINRSGLPAGAFNLIMGSGREAGQTLVDHPLVNAVSFTGSVATFDNFQVGVLQAQSIVDKLGLKQGKGPFNIELFGGSPDDNNAFFFYDGAMSVLQPYIDSGKLVVRSKQTGMNKVGTLRWDGATAQARMDNLLSAYYGKDKLDAVLSPYDGISIGILSSLKGVGYCTAQQPCPVVTGQDAEVPSVKSILKGEQYSTVFKDTRELAKVAANMVDAVLSGKQPEINDTKTYNNGVKVVPSYLLKPVLVDQSNWKKVLLDSGYYKESQIK